MNIAHALARPLSRPAPPPPGGFRDSLPEAFAALDADGEVMVIGYQGEWYEPIRPSLLTRLHNWLIAVGNRRIEADERGVPPRRITAVQTYLLILGSLFALLALASFGMACYVLGHAPQPYATQGMFGFATLTAFSAFGAFFCGYRVRHGEWP